MTMITRRLPGLLVAGFLALALPAAALAAGGTTSTTGDSTADENLDMAKTAIAQFKYDKAKEYLEKVLAVTPDNADALNLMGFTERKLGDPTDSLTYYNKALALNPNHLGANEYLGELYLEMKDVKKAKERLAVLKQACGGTCEEYRSSRKRSTSTSRQGGPQQLIVRRCRRLAAALLRSFPAGSRRSAQVITIAVGWSWPAQRHLVAARAPRCRGRHARPRWPRRRARPRIPWSASRAGWRYSPHRRWRSAWWRGHSPSRRRWPGRHGCRCRCAAARFSSGASERFSSSQIERHLPRRAERAPAGVRADRRRCRTAP